MLDTEDNGVIESSLSKDCIEEPEDREIMRGEMAALAEALFVETLFAEALPEGFELVEKSAFKLLIAFR